MTEPLQPFPHFIHFLEQVEQAADRKAWSTRRVRDELRGERRQRMQRADYELFQLLSKANRFLDHLARHHHITTAGADRLAAFLLTSAREVIREVHSAQAWGWAPKHDRRILAEREWKLAQRRQGSALQSAVEQLIEQLRPTKGDSCGKQ